MGVFMEGRVQALGRRSGPDLQEHPPREGEGDSFCSRFRTVLLMSPPSPSFSLEFWESSFPGHMGLSVGRRGIGRDSSPTPKAKSNAYLKFSQKSPSLLCLCTINIPDSLLLKSCLFNTSSISSGCFAFPFGFIKTDFLFAL